jgi:hypothetical protein
MDSNLICSLRQETQQAKKNTLRAATNLLMQTGTENLSDPQVKRARKVHSLVRTANNNHETSKLSRQDCKLKHRKGKSWCIDLIPLSYAIGKKNKLPTTIIKPVIKTSAWQSLLSCALPQPQKGSRHQARK